MVEISTIKFTVAEALDILGKSPRWLIEETGLSAGVIYRCLDESPVGRKIHETSAAKIAVALGLSVDDIRWPRGRCDTGRPALATTLTVEVRVIVRQTTTQLCPDCYLVLPVTGQHDDCLAA